MSISYAVFCLKKKKADPAAEQLSASQKTVLFRVAQESLTNVIRNTHARSVEIAIRENKNLTCKPLADEGRSFKYTRKNAPNGKPRLGLMGMQERVLFFFNDTSTPDIYTLSLHDALPICR